MAERKTPAKRKGPTRAAALKALGLTKEDLDTLKVVEAAREASDSDTEREALERIVGHRLVTPSDLKDSFVEDDPRYAKCTCGPNEKCDNCPPLEEKFDGQDPQAALEERPAPEQRAWDAPDPDAEPIFYARNLRGVDVGFRLTRQKDTSTKRTDLKPRGSRGDMVKLEPGDLKDAELRTQVGYGLVEVIPEGEALEAMKKQYTNRGSEVPAHIAMLRNPKGEEYAQADPVRFASDEEAYGVKVADLDPGLMQGKLSDKEIKRGGGFAQNASQTPTGGNPAIISDGFIAPVQQDMSGDNEKQAQVDAKLRAKQFENRPEDNLGVRVTIGETERVQ